MESDLHSLIRLKDHLYKEKNAPCIFTPGPHTYVPWS